MPVTSTLAAGALLALAACTSPSPVLVDASAVDGVESVRQNEVGSYAPGWTWCQSIRPALLIGGEAASSTFVFDDGALAGATVIDATADGLTAEDVVEVIDDQATGCAESEAAAAQGSSIEPLDDRREGEHGWRTETADGEWGEYVLVPLDDRRVLVAGFETTGDEPPVDLDDLVRLAREGAERVASGPAA